MPTSLGPIIRVHFDLSPPIVRLLQLAAEGEQRSKRSIVEEALKVWCEGRGYAVC